MSSEAKLLSLPKGPRQRCKETSAFSMIQYRSRVRFGYCEYREDAYLITEEEESGKYWASYMCTVEEQPYREQSRLSQHWDQGRHDQ